MQGPDEETAGCRVCAITLARLQEERVPDWALDGSQQSREIGVFEFRIRDMRESAMERDVAKGKGIIFKEGRIL